MRRSTRAAVGRCSPASIVSMSTKRRAEIWAGNLAMTLNTCSEICDLTRSVAARWRLQWVPRGIIMKRLWMVVNTWCTEQISKIVSRGHHESFLCLSFPDEIHPSLGPDAHDLSRKYSRTQPACRHGCTCPGGHPQQIVCGQRQCGKNGSVGLVSRWW